MNKIIVGVIVVAVVVIAGVLIAGMETPRIPDENGAAMEAEVVAEEWVQENAKTFTDREGEELTHVSTEEIEESVFEVSFEFDSRFAGYGELADDEVAAQVITSHVIVVSVEDGEVVGAVTDEVFNEYEGAMIEEDVDERVTVNVYFAVVEEGQEIVVSVEREVPADGKEEYTLLELLERPEEGDYFTAIAEGTTLNSFLIEDGVAYVDFSSELDASGSATVTMIREQIESTLLQFDTVNEVEISIEGEVEEILQP